MSQIVVERGEGSFADRFRPYKVIIDGQYRGTIRQKEKWAFAVSPGTHTVSFRIDYYHSPAIRVAVVNRTRLVCRSSAAHAFGLLAIFSPGEWITVREEDSAGTMETPSGDDIALVKEPAAPRGFFRKRSAARAAKSNVTEPAYRLADRKSDEATEARRLLELDLREVVNARALDVQYEPQMDLRTQRIVGFEVLVRWRHPVRGLVSPSVFVPIAEQLGLMGAIGQLVLEQACAEAATWPEDIGLSINASQRQLADPACPAIFMAALKSSGLRPNRLEVEVAESVVMEHDAAVASTFEMLRQAGVRIAIDNFGLAFSTHSYVPETIFDKVKISRSVIKPHAETQGASSIIRAVVGLCSSLDMACCAVGVENKEQLSLLLAEGCTQAQGRVFGPPLMAREIPALLARINKGEAGADPAVASQGATQTAVSFFQVVESANDTVIITTADLDAPGPVIIYVNPAFTRLTGFTPAEVIGLTPRILQGPGTSRATLDRIRTALGEGRTVREKLLNFGKNGAPYWADVRIVPMRAADGSITHFAATQRDVTMDKRYMDEIEYFADRNPLTGIPNGRALARTVENEIARIQESSAAAALGLCVAFVEIDGFAALQDDLGSQVADAILHGMADRLADNVRRSDTLCHISGEIFAVCMPSITQFDAEAILANLCRAVTVAPFATSAGQVATTISVGVASHTPGEDAASLIHRADEAMHFEKRARSNRAVAMTV